MLALFVAIQKISFYQRSKNEIRPLVRLRAKLFPPELNAKTKLRLPMTFFFDISSNRQEQVALDAAGP